MIGIILRRLTLVKLSHCLIRNLSEIDSLPHLRNLSEMPPPERRGRRGDEADDERTRSRYGGDGGAVSPHEQEAERAAARRAGGAHRLQPLVCGRATARRRQVVSWPAGTGGSAAATTAAVVRWDSADGVAAHLGDHGLHLRQAPGGGVAGDDCGARAARRAAARRGDATEAGRDQRR